jgi:hypothetical protein
MPLAVSSISNRQHVIEETDPTWSQALSVWWLIVWRGFAGSLLLGAAQGLLSLIAVAEQERKSLPLIIYLLQICWLVWVTLMALRKRYKGFRIAVLSLGPHGEIIPFGLHDEVKLTLSEAMAVWWVMAWRGALGYLLLIFILGLIKVGESHAGNENEMIRSFAMDVLSLTLFCLALGWSIAVVRMALLKQYSRFRVAIVSPGPDRKEISAVYE